MPPLSTANGKRSSADDRAWMSASAAVTTAEIANPVRHESPPQARTARTPGTARSPSDAAIPIRAMLRSLSLGLASTSAPSAAASEQPAPGPYNPSASTMTHGRCASAAITAASAIAASDNEENQRTRIRSLHAMSGASIRSASE